MAWWALRDVVAVGRVICSFYSRYPEVEMIVLIKAKVTITTLRFCFISWQFKKDNDLPWNGEQTKNFLKRITQEFIWNTMKI